MSDRARFITGIVLHVLHVWGWGLYGGNLVYAYFRLFPDVQRWSASDERYEDFSLKTGAGLRWWIFGVLCASGITGVALAVTQAPLNASRTWWIIVAVKAVLLAVMLAVYARVSYVMWPRRVFVAQAERDRERHRFFRVALLLMALLLAQGVLGAVVHVGI